MSGLRGMCSRCSRERWLDETTERCAACAPYAETHVRIARAEFKQTAFLVVCIAFVLGIIVGRAIG